MCGTGAKMNELNFNTSDSDNVQCIEMNQVRRLTV